MSHEDKDEKTNIATQLVKMVSHYELFHDTFNNGYISLSREGHIENWPLDGELIKSWLAHQYYEQTGLVPSKSALSDAISTLLGLAKFKGPEHQVYNRVAKSNNSYYIDLGDAEWRCIEVNAGGWKVLSQAPVRFKRGQACHAIPVAKRGGDIAALWDFLNIKNEGERLLTLSWMLDCLRTDTDYPLLIIEGEQGSAKSSTQKRIKALIDPSAMELRATLKKPQELVIAAQNDHLLSYNNLSYLPPELQDILCNLATGGSFGQRELYTNMGEIMVDIRRPVILNGISGLISAQDLSERCIHLELPSISENKRESGVDLDARFKAAHPYLMGGLLDLFSNALGELPKVIIENKPRMTDFFRLGIAVARVLGYEDEYFINAYATNQAIGVRKGLESSPVAMALETFIENNPSGYSGNLKQLLERLNPHRPDESAGWPRSPKGLKSALNRQQSAFRKMGISIYFDPTRQSDGYQVQIEKI
ncbi:MAG: hypothetical protein ACI85E_001623 [Marinomonas primoryensis]|jgi:hypothetical protein